MASSGAAPALSDVPVSTSSNHAEKPDKFNGMDFKRWQQKILFYLITLNLARFLTEGVPTLKEREHNAESVSAVEAWNHSDFVCGNYVLNGLVDALRFLDFKMLDSKPVICQVQELKLIRHDIHAEGMTVSESFQMAAIIEKLPPAWKEFKNYLKHK
ncbi:hypothetical protein F511_19978 [Dorcoceras hygrometricum]|uniref:Uncharacterized protein n=1 Tax=Dorcoceras hygrometricum TaxID=472368 RepID=A0A2Z7BNJ8_9LAMI|nr:hypothetical protein F511_19978 [Dorcoceras hygrometricum]